MCRHCQGDPQAPKHYKKLRHLPNCSHHGMSKRDCTAALSIITDSRVLQQLLASSGVTLLQAPTRATQPAVARATIASVPTAGAARSSNELPNGASLGAGAVRMPAQVVPPPRSPGSLGAASALGGADRVHQRPRPSESDSDYVGSGGRSDGARKRRSEAPRTSPPSPQQPPPQYAPLQPQQPGAAEIAIPLDSMLDQATAGLPGMPTGFASLGPNVESWDPQDAANAGAPPRRAPMAGAAGGMF